MKLYENLRILADSYQQLQKSRIALGNRLSALERGSDKNGVVEDRWAKWQTELLAIEKEIGNALGEEVSYHPAWPFLERVKGIGPLLGGQMLGLIGDIADFNTISKLWRFAVGMPVDGKVEKPKRGEKLHYSARLKKTMYLIGSSFLKQNSPYRAIYDEAKEYYQANREWTKLRIHYAALRKMEKVFLAHLWLEWRRALGLPTRSVYVIEHGGHTMEYKAEEFLEPSDK